MACACEGAEVEDKDKAYIYNGEKRLDKPTKRYIHDFSLVLFSFPKVF